ncbi:MAG: ATP-binding protein [Anaerolineae bacterium]
MKQRLSKLGSIFGSIRTRLTFTHLAVIVVAMGLSGLLLLSLLEGYFVRAMEDSLVAQARITAQALIPGATVEGPSIDASAAAYNTVQQQVVSNLSLQAQNVAVPEGGNVLGELNVNNLADATLQLSTQLDTRIRLVDSHGIVIVDSQQESQGEDLTQEPLVRQALGGQYTRPTVLPGDAQEMQVAMPMTVGDRLVGAVYLSQSLKDVNAVMRDLRLRWLLATVIALGLSGAVGLLLSGAISRPVRRLTMAAGAVAEGKLDQQVPVETRDELGRLSQAFNEMTARLRTARQMQVDFVANVSHELRTPLTAVKGLVETLRDGAVDDADVRDRFLETMEDETDRLIRLVNDLLILSRADSEALSLRCGAVDLADLAQSIVERLSPWAEEHDITLQVRAAPCLPAALADVDRMEQVFLNLLDNSIKFSRPGGTVSVDVQGGPGSMVQVQIQDEGIGIPAEALPNIGERFYRADRARSRAQGGSGLGLAIARALIEAQGGCLWVESEEGQGTMVGFQIPAA